MSPHSSQTEPTGGVSTTPEPKQEETEEEETRQTFTAVFPLPTWTRRVQNHQFLLDQSVTRSAHLLTQAAVHHSSEISWTVSQAANGSHMANAACGSFRTLVPVLSPQWTTKHLILKLRFYSEVLLPAVVLVGALEDQSINQSHRRHQPDQ